MNKEATVYGVGFINEEKTRKDGKFYPEYSLWASILARCYPKKLTKAKLSYQDCYVSENFKDYSYFKKWCNNQIGFQCVDDNGRAFHLDKDILIKGNKVYSEDTCCFVPPEINSLFVKSNARRGEYLIGVFYRNDRKKYQASMNCVEGSNFIGYFNTEIEAFKAYKKAKESKLKDVAELYKDKIDHRVYDALMTYQVEITD